MQDYKDRINPELMTRLLRAAIPVLEQSDWRITLVEEGVCETLLPLIKATTNSNGTLQGALISLSADYTGGMALTTLLRGVPVAGVHPCRNEESASLWLAGMNVRYFLPGTGHLTGICRIPPEQADDIRRRYFRGDRVLTTLKVQFYANGELTAEADMKYFAQPTIQLTPASTIPARSTLFNHKLKASARMVAAIRGQESSHSRLQIQCPHATMVAGPHGLLLADHLQTILPQLKDMVQARSQHIDELIQQIPDLRQVVLAGVGLDMRSITHAEHFPNITFFEMDLPEMIAERERVAQFLPKQFSERRVLLKADFKSDDVARIVGQHERFDPAAPTVIIFEGCSMYFSEAENRRLLASFQELMQHPLSCIWADFVHSAVVNRRTNNQRIIRFLEGMDSLGESFVFGPDNPVQWLESLGFSFVDAVTSEEYLKDSDPVLANYSFAIARN